MFGHSFTIQRNSHANADEDVKDPEAHPSTDQNMCKHCTSITNASYTAIDDTPEENEEVVQQKLEVTIRTLGKVDSIDKSLKRRSKVVGRASFLLLSNAIHQCQI